MTLNVEHLLRTVQTLDLEKTLDAIEAHGRQDQAAAAVSQGGADFGTKKRHQRQGHHILQERKSVYEAAKRRTPHR